MAERRKSSPEKPETGDTSPPAYFLSVSVENVRCFGPKQTLDLSDGNGRPAQWTVILGDNGTGKTTLLQILSQLEPILILPSFRGRSVEGLGDTTIRLDKLVVPREYTSPKVFGRLGEVMHIGGKIGFGRTLSAVTGVVSTGMLGIHRGESQNQADAEQVDRIGGLVVYAYGAARWMSGPSMMGEIEDSATEGLFSDNAFLPNAEEWLLQADYAANRATEPLEKERAVRRRDQIIEVLVSLLPDVDEIRFAEPQPPSLIPRVEFKTPYGWVTVDQLSLGYRTMIAWTVDVARRQFERYPDSPNPLAEPAVVLVDEIDLHLHPKWQRTIMDFLGERFPNTQFIVTAHSPLVVQAATNANIAVLRREGDHVVIDNDVKAIRNWRVDQILTSDLFNLPSARPPELDNLLEKRRTLLSKSRLTAADRKSLKDIEAKIGELPAGETPAEMEAMDIIRRAAERLKRES